jgi:hypothetical protein
MTWPWYSFLALINTIVGSNRIKDRPALYRVVHSHAVNLCSRLPIIRGGDLFRKLTSVPWFFNWYGGGGVPLGPFGIVATNRPIVPTPSDYDDGEIGGIIGRGNRSTRRKPAPVIHCPPQIPHAARKRTRAAAVGSQRLTTWATARPYCATCQKMKFIQNCLFKRRNTKRREVYFAFEYVIGNSRRRSLFRFSSQKPHSCFC